MKPFIVYDRMGNAIMEGTVYSNGKVGVCWLGQYSSLVAWNSLEDFKQVSMDPRFGRDLVFVGVTR